MLLALRSRRDSIDESTHSFGSGVEFDRPDNLCLIVDERGLHFCSHRSVVHFHACRHRRWQIGDGRINIMLISASDKNDQCGGERHDEEEFIKRYIHGNFLLRNLTNRCSCRACQIDVYLYSAFDMPFFITPTTKAANTAP
ncbi:MAG: hypothetical protein ABI479_11970 [Gallionella sp.]